jgi:hypothetical protein
MTAQRANAMIKQSMNRRSDKTHDIELCEPFGQAKEKKGEDQPFQQATAVDE